MRRMRKLFGRRKPAAGPGIGAALVAVVLIACSGEAPAGPEAPDPPEDSTPVAPEPSDRVLPEEVFDVTLRACERCVPGTVPDYLLAFSDGVRARFAIMAATESTASVELVEMRRLGETSADLLGLFGGRIIHLVWNGPEGVFRGFVEYGTAALFVASLHRAGSQLECDFDLLHLKHDVGATSCSTAD